MKKITNSHVSKYQILTRDLQFKTVLRIAFHLQFDIMLILNYYDVFRSNLMKRNNLGLSYSFLAPHILCILTENTALLIVPTMLV